MIQKDAEWIEMNSQRGKLGSFREMASNMAVKHNLGKPAATNRKLDWDESYVA